MEKIRKGVSARLQFIKELYKWGWRWVVFVVWGLPYLVASFYDFLRGEWFPSWRALSELLPNWLPPAWFIVGLISFLLVTVEGAHRLVQNERDKHPKPKLIPLQNRHHTTWN